MAIPSEFLAGLRIYGLGPELDSERHAVWRLLEPRMGEIGDRIITDLVGLVPGLSERLEANRAACVESITRSTRLMFAGAHDEAWLASVNERIEFEKANKYDIRSRPSINRMILTALSDIVGRRYRFSAARALRTMDIAQRVLFHDAGLAANLHYASSLKTARATGKELAAALEHFELATLGVRRSVSAGAETLRGTAAELSGVHDSVGDEAERASRASAATAAHVDTAAQATEHLSAAIEAIEREATSSAARASEAVTRMHGIHATIQSLSQAVERIGSVVDVIAEVASQTNLLALNATIEAARAGEAGRGFAVVAVEVKALAAQTSQATVQIAELIKAVQESTGRAVTETEGAGAQINSVAEVASRLADAVHRENTAAGEIARTASANAANTATMTSAMKIVAGGIARTRATGASIHALSQDLAAKTRAFDTAVDLLFATTRKRDAAVSPLANILRDTGTVRA